MNNKALAAVLAVMIALPGKLCAMQQPPQAVAEQARPIAPLPTTQSLRVIVLAGDGDRNDLKRGVMAPLVVQVLDQNLRPVEGAQVIFRFPLTGPGAFFPDQKNSLTTTTNADGQVAATGWIANRQTGQFTVRVTASHRNEIGDATVKMWNMASIDVAEKAARKHWYSSRWAKIGILAGVGAGVAAGILLSRGGSGGSASGTITATPGSPSVGGPR